MYCKRILKEVSYFPTSSSILTHQWQDDMRWDIRWADICVKAVRIQSQLEVQIEWHCIHIVNDFLGESLRIISTKCLYMSPFEVDLKHGIHRLGGKWEKHPFLRMFILVLKSQQHIDWNNWWQKILVQSFMLPIHHWRIIFLEFVSVQTHHCAA